MVRVRRHENSKERVPRPSGFGTNPTKVLFMDPGACIPIINVNGFKTRSEESGSIERKHPS